MMSSGMNGQNFAFNGYLPIDRNDRKKELKTLEKISKERNQSQIFIETPYREVKNGKVTEDIKYISPIEEGDYVIAQASAPLDSKNKFLEELVPVRFKNEFELMKPERVDLMDVSPHQ